MSLFNKNVPAERIRKEKDEEIQQLTDELNRHRYHPGKSLGQLSSMIDSIGDITEGRIEEEIPPKTYPERLKWKRKKKRLKKLPEPWLANKIPGTCSSRRGSNQETIVDPKGNLP